MLNPAIGSIGWLRLVRGFEYEEIEGMEEYMYSPPIVVVAILPNGNVICYTVGSNRSFRNGFADL